MTLPFALEYDLKLQMPDIGAVALTEHCQSLLLSHILSRCEGRSLFFDLDSTLLNNRPRNAIIMSEFGKVQRNEKLIKADTRHFPDWSVGRSMQALGLDQTEIDSLLEPHRTFWQKRFFTSDYCRYDITVPGATQFVREAAANGAQILYLTGRHDEMRAGTLESLERLGFPVPSSLPKPSGGRENHPLQLITKPAFDESDDLYKQRIIGTIRNSTHVLAAFDNEPVHINYYNSACPDALSVHLMTDHSMRKTQLNEAVYSIRDFSY